MTNFGASFRKAREAAGLPLDKIAAETRISTRFLLAIESEDFHLLPGGVFNRGFVRAYAAHLGMDPEQAVTEYSRISSTTDEPLEVLRNVERETSRRAERNLYPIIFGLLLLLVAVYYFVNRGSTSKPVESAVPNAVPEASTPPPPTEPPGILAAPSLAQIGAIEPLPSIGATTPAAREPSNRPAEAQANSPFSVPALVLELEVKELTWIRISTDGLVALNDSMSPGTTRRFSAERSIDVTLGNAAGASLKINGRDMGELGARGRVREFKITPENATRIQG